MDIEIREIKQIDYPEIILLWNKEINNHNVNEENITSIMATMTKDNNYKTFVALSENKVVGFITVVQTLAVGFAVGYLKINGLAVQKDLQNRGIGTKLFKHVENYALKKGLSSLILNSGFKRSDAHAFYEHNGYEKTSYCFVKEI